MSPVANHAWRSYRSAPPSGTRVLKACEINAGESRCVSVESENGRFPLLMVRSSEGKLYSYVNACPHQYLPLDSRGDKVLSQDASLLICTAHQATFQVHSGECISGPSTGEALDPVPVVEDDEGWLLIGE
ncbi:Rieske 2Fe-2S domain-containing protein [Halomonas binhaiensis]|uniref:Rieske 2Fe-2S domain-containing protein n=2 Tax=Halomonas binhaiensis TaxID=2562282 RepID=A0A5C1NPV3_9GAMM|nr:Rieske 2Fe-2S domain-containing protein [Halomonas binhaiensis]